MKSALLMFHIMNYVFLTNKILYFCFKKQNKPSSKEYNEFVECIGRHKNLISNLRKNIIIFVDKKITYPSIINIL